MADKGQRDTTRSAKKRLARAKIKPADSGVNSAKGRPAAADGLSSAQKKKQRKSRLTAIAVGVFAVIMALSMTLPSLAYIFGDQSPQAEAAPEASDDADATQDEASDQDEDEQAATGMDAVDANYAAVVDPLKEKLDDSPDDLATLLNLGNDYMAWGNEASAYATDDSSSAHVSELYASAIEYFDRYLELNDSSAVKVSRAMCQLYSGDTEAAIDALEGVTKDDEAYGPAWADLGMIYEYMGDQDTAKEYYQKAVEADPDDEYGAKTYANRRIAAMAAQTEDLTEDTEAAVEGNESGSTTGAAALEEALGSVL